jgi:hypothetical protein
MKNALIQIATLLAILLLTACSTHIMPLTYQASRYLGNTEHMPLVASTRVIDERNTDSNWLGAIRGGFGNPLKELRSDKPVNEAVNDVLISALKARNMLGTNETSNKQLEVSIRKLDCSYYMNREAHVYLQVDVLALPNRVPLFSHEYRTDNVESGLGAGIFGDVDHLAQFAQKTLNETIDKVLDDPQLRSALAAK